MARIDEELSARFHRWEQRTRGWPVHPHAVAPEPPFAPFSFGGFCDQPVVDDGRKPTVLSTFVRNLFGAPPSPPPLPEPEVEPEAEPVERARIVELPLFLPDGFSAKPDEMASFVRSLTRLAEPITFELLGTTNRVTAQLAVGARDEPAVRQQLRAFFPEIVCTPSGEIFATAWQATENAETAVIEFGLEREVVLPLAEVSHDLCVPLIGVLSELAEGELALYQVLFQPVTKPWADNLLRAVTDASGDNFFVNTPDLLKFTKEKTAAPLYGVVVRVAARAPEYDRVIEIIRNLASALSAFALPTGNELIPLRNDAYPQAAHTEDVLRRQSRRSGMLLNLDELLGFIRFPTDAVSSPKFLRQTQKTKAAPAAVTGNDGIALGTNTHAGESRTVRLTPDHRVRHTHIIGASGTGKSTLLFNLIRQDIESGQGVGVLDPHGDLIDKILGIIPPERIDDVVLLDPGDEEFTVGFNILSAHADWEKNLLASDLVSVFRRLSTSWGDQMGSVLNNAIRAFLESTRGGTIADLQRFLLEPAFRENFLGTVRDEAVIYYWRKGFPQLAGNKSIGPILTRLDSFLGPKPIRYMVSQTDSRLDFGNILDTGKIFLAKLSQGAIGRENSFLLGSLLVAKFQQVAMARQRQEEKARRDFWLYLDEFQDFITSSTAEILRGGRKYRIGLTLAHQELRPLQRDPDVASAVLSNPCTRICFRVGDQDARALESNFSFFESRDLQNLDTGQAVGRVERSDSDFNLTVPWPELPDAGAAATRRNEVITASRNKYATPRAAMEAAFAAPVPSAGAAASTPARVEKSAGSVGATAPLPTVAPPQPAPAPEPPRVREEKPIGQPTDPGRGGAQHKAIQLRLKAAAEALGFRALVEKPILAGAGNVDLVLERDGATLAVEITVTTTIDHEVGNVAKCVKAGFSRIAVVGVNADKLAKIQGAVANSLGPEVAARVSFYLPDDFLAALTDLPPPAPPPPTTVKVRGWTAKAKYTAVSPEETQAREDALIHTVAASMKNSRHKKPAG